MGTHTQINTTIRKRGMLLASLLIILIGAVSANGASHAHEHGTTVKCSMVKPCVNNEILLSGVPGTTTQVTWIKDGVTFLKENMKPLVSTIAGGEETGSQNGFSFPAGIAIDKAGNIYVADQFNHRVQRWAPGATVGVTVAGGYREGPSAEQLHYPLAVTIDDAGNLYVLDAGNHRVQRWAPGANVGVTVAGGNGKGTAANQLNVPHGVAVNAQGDVFVADNYNHRIQYWAKGATTGITIAGGHGAGRNLDQLVFPTNVKLDEQGNVYIADSGNDRILKYDPGTKEIKIVAGGQGRGGRADQFYYPTDMAIGKNGDVYVTDHVNQRVQLWKEGASTGITVAGGQGQGKGMEQFNFPYAITTDQYDNLYVIDQYNHRIQYHRNTSSPLTYEFSLKAKEAGEYMAVLTDRDGNKLKTNTIKVSDNIILPSFKIAQSLCAGSRQLLPSTVSGSWKTSDVSVAYIDNGNELVTVSEGTVTIQYLPADSNRCTIRREELVTVRPLPVFEEIIPLTPGYKYQELSDDMQDKEQQLTVCAGTRLLLTSQRGEWRSMDTGIARVNDNWLTATRPGTTQLDFTIEQDGCTATKKAAIIVMPAPAVSAVAGLSRVATGNTIQLHASGQTGEWLSADEKVASIDSRGLVKGIGAGNTHIQFRQTDKNGCTAEASMLMMVFPPSPRVKDSVYTMTARSTSVDPSAQVIPAQGMQLKWYKTPHGNTPAIDPVVANEPGQYVLWVSQFDNGVSSLRVPCKITIVRNQLNAFSSLQVDVLGNPVVQFFTVRINGRQQQPISMRVLDLQGRVLEQRNGVAAGSTLQFGHQYAGGQYILECIQGNDRKAVQLLKAGGRAATITARAGQMIQ